ncbi:MAG: lysyl oxidase family protein [Bacteroidota bacterium]
MKYTTLIILFLSISLHTFGQDCGSQLMQIVVHIQTDDFGGETAWQLIDKNGTSYGGADFGSLGNNELYQDTFCIPRSACATFYIQDSYSDGIFDPGYFLVWQDGELVVDNPPLTGEWVTDLNCPAGATCRTALSISEGKFTAPEDNTWYEYQPSAPGAYRVSTCFNSNNCDTKIWIYGSCLAFAPEDNTGTTLYDDNGGSCGDLAVVQGSFDPGRIYYIRIGDSNEDCNNAPIQWRIEYLGPISGCTDPDACNYDPLASIDDGSCIPQGTPECPEGPDLVLNQQEFETTIRLDVIDSYDDCLIQEGCLRGYGLRDILRFSTRIDNIGEQDYYAGRPENNPAQFTYDNCHQHYHYDGYAEYLLYDENGTELQIGFKNGFCVIDLYCDTGVEKYSCDNMGITAGCSDIYWSDLECQWIDITEVPDGRYVFVNRVNWLNLPDALGRVEKDTSNNWAQVCLIIDRSSGQLSVELDEECDPFVDCAGVVYGNSQPDCKGECGGAALSGDVNNNGMQELDDVERYVTRLLGNDMLISSCNDLNADLKLTVYDAALLNNCLLYGRLHQHVDGGAHDHCNFPDGVLSLESATLSILDYDLNNQYIDIGILNTASGVVAFDFQMEGLQLQGVETLVDEELFPVDLSYSLAGHVIGLSYQDSSLEKTATPQPLCRLYYSQITANEVCIADFIDAVDDNYAQLNTFIGGDCLMTTSTGLEPSQRLQVQIQPNPFTEATYFRFNNEAGEAFRLQVTDLKGRRLYLSPETRGNEIRFERAELAAGLYLYQLQSSSKIRTGKLIIQ